MWFFGGLNGCGTWWKDRNQAGQETPSTPLCLLTTSPFQRPHCWIFQADRIRRTMDLDHEKKSFVWPFETMTSSCLPGMVSSLQIDQFLSMTLFKWPQPILFKDLFLTNYFHKSLLSQFVIPWAHLILYPSTKLWFPWGQKWYACSLFIQESASFLRHTWYPIVACGMRELIHQFTHGLGAQPSREMRHRVTMWFAAA